MARRKRMRCNIGEKRFTVLRIDGDPYDTHAARSFEEALKIANPDRGSKIDVFSVCSDDPGAARLPSTYQKRGKLVRSFRSKRGG